MQHTRKVLFVINAAEKPETRWRPFPVPRTATATAHAHSVYTDVDIVDTTTNTTITTFNNHQQQHVRKGCATHFTPAQVVFARAHGTLRIPHGTTTQCY